MYVLPLHLRSVPGDHQRRFDNWTIRCFQINHLFMFQLSRFRLNLDTNRFGPVLKHLRLNTEFMKL